MRQCHSDLHFFCFYYFFLCGDRFQWKCLVPKVILTVGTAFKPTLGELYKKHPVCTKICLFEIQNHPLLTPHLLGSFGALIFVTTALELCASSPHLLILELPLFGLHTSFLGNDPCSYVRNPSFRAMTLVVEQQKGILLVKTSCFRESKGTS